MVAQINNVIDAKAGDVGKHGRSWPSSAEQASSAYEGSADGSDRRLMSQVDP